MRVPAAAGRQPSVVIVHGASIRAAGFSPRSLSHESAPQSHTVIPLVRESLLAPSRSRIPSRGSRN